MEFETIQLDAIEQVAVVKSLETVHFNRIDELDFIELLEIMKFGPLNEKRWISHNYWKWSN